MMNLGKVNQEHSSSNARSPVLSSSFQENLDGNQLDNEIIYLENERYENIQMNPNEQYITAEPFVIEDIQCKKYSFLYVTNYRIIILREQNKTVPYGYIENLVASQQRLEIRLKTGIMVQIGGTQEVIRKLEKCILAEIDNLPFCFVNAQEREEPKIYNPWTEINKMGLNWSHYSIFKNQNGLIFPYYPQFFVIPKDFTSQTIQEIKKCRHQGKIPIMSLYYSVTEVAVWRGSTKRAQIPENKVIYDTSYVKSISNDVHIINFETKQSLNSFITLRNMFQNFTNKYAAMAESKVPYKSDIFLKTLGQWFEEINRLITISYSVVEKLREKKHVLLEQKTNSDRNSQVMALCSIILNPFYRSFEGFSILIQKQFVGFRHQFELRGGFNRDKTQDSAPIFIQFLQAVHQLVATHPSCFEYSSTFLAKIGYQFYTTKYNNFIKRPSMVFRSKSSELDYRKKVNCSNNVWDSVNRLRSHKNYLYIDDGTTNKPLNQIRKKPSLKQYVIWIQYFDLISKMNGQKQVIGSPNRQSQQISQYLTKSVI